VPTKIVLKVGFLERDHLAEKSYWTKMGQKIHCARSQFDKKCSPLNLKSKGATVVKSFSKTPAIIIFHTFSGLHIHAQWEDSCRKEKSSTHPYYSAELFGRPSP
jgi:hypothetical protein